MFIYIWMYIIKHLDIVDESALSKRNLLLCLNIVNTLVKISLSLSAVSEIDFIL